MEPVGFEPGICLSRPKSHLVNANELVIGHNWRVSIDNSSAAGGSGTVNQPAIVLQRKEKGN